MYGLRFRGALDSTTQAELEGLIATLQEFLLAEHNEDGTHRPVGSDLVPVPIGATMAWWTESIPAGWLLCDGRAVSRTRYAKLFKAIGTRYGVGNGVDTFNVPNGEGKFLVGSFSGASLGATGGTWNHTHGIEDEAAHSHTVNAHNHTIASGGAHTHTIGAHIHGISGANTAAAGVDVTVRAAATQGVSNDDPTSSDGAHDHGGTTGNATPGTSSAGGHDHGGETDTANPPYLAVHYIILAGV